MAAEPLAPILRAEEQRVVLGVESQGRSHDDGRREGDDDEREQKYRHQRAARAARLLLTREEIHGLERRARLAERYLRDGALLSVLDLEKLGRLEAEFVRDQVAGEVLAGVVVAQYGIVERLARERDLVLRRRQLFLELNHVLIRLQVGIGFREREQAPQRAAERRLGGRERLDGIGIGRVGGGFPEAGLRRVAGVDDGLESAALVAHVPFDGLDEVRNQVVAARQLDIDLRESVTHAVARVDEVVVNRDRVED